MVTISSLIADGAKRLAGAGVADANFEARALALHLLGWDANAAVIRRDEELPSARRAEYDALVKRRAGGVPLQYITQRAAFYELTAYCDERVLIPRPETEILAGAALDMLAARGLKRARVVDIGTGSGVLALTIKQFAPTAEITATDISAEALAVARINARELGLDVKFVEADVFGALSGEFDLVVANPPYIKRAALADLQREVQFEPKLALDGGADGLKVIRPLLAGLTTHLAPGGAALIEIDPPILDGVRALAAELLPERTISVQKDFNALARILVIE